VTGLLLPGPPLRPEGLHPPGDVRPLGRVELAPAAFASRRPGYPATADTAASQGGPGGTQSAESLLEGADFRIKSFENLSRHIGVKHYHNLSFNVILSHTKSSKVTSAAGCHHSNRHSPRLGRCSSSRNGAFNELAEPLDSWCCAWMNAVAVIFSCLQMSDRESLINGAWDPIWR